VGGAHQLQRPIGWKSGLGRFAPTLGMLGIELVVLGGEGLMTDVRIWCVHVDGDHPKPDCSEEAQMELKAL